MGRSNVHGIKERRAGALERLLSDLKSTVSLEKGNKKAETAKQKKIARLKNNISNLEAKKNYSRINK